MPDPAAPPLRGHPLALALARGADDGVLEAFKWLALLSMVVHHVGSLVAGEPKSSWSHEFGRLAFPLFAIVLACRLHLRHLASGAVRGATALRMLAWGVASEPIFRAATGWWWPPDIFFTLALGAAACWVPASGWPRPLRIAAYALLALLSLLCDYHTPGVFLIPAVFHFCRKPRLASALGVALCVAGLVFLNQSLVTLVPFALAPLAFTTHLRLRPVGRLFYFFYPAHLAAIAAWVHWH